MKLVKPVLLVLFPFAFTSAPLLAQAPATPAPGAGTPSRPAWKEKLYVGGGVGLAFGDVDYVEIAPLVGYNFHPRVSAGAGAFYRWKSDDRYASSVDTTDYGGNLFARFAVTAPVFLHGEWEYLDYEYVDVAGASFRDSESNFLAGAGFVQPMGGKGAFSASVLYNFSYDDNDPTRAYDSPWVYRFGVTFGF
jgi:hypothetical protein